MPLIDVTTFPRWRAGEQKGTVGSVTEFTGLSWLEIKGIQAWLGRRLYWRACSICVECARARGLKSTAMVWFVAGWREIRSQSVVIYHKIYCNLLQSLKHIKTRWTSWTNSIYQGNSATEKLGAAPGFSAQYAHVSVGRFGPRIKPSPRPPFRKMKLFFSIAAQAKPEGGLTSGLDLTRFYTTLQGPWTTWTMGSCSHSCTVDCVLLGHWGPAGFSQGTQLFPVLDELPGLRSAATHQDIRMNLNIYWILHDFTSICGMGRPPDRLIPLWKYGLWEQTQSYLFLWLKSCESQSLSKSPGCEDWDWTPAKSLGWWIQPWHIWR